MSKSPRDVNIEVLHYWKHAFKDVTKDEFDSKTSIRYIAWFIDHAIDQAPTLPLDKLGRWVGYIQAILATLRLSNVDGERERTRPSFEEAYRFRTSILRRHEDNHQSPYMYGKPLKELM